ncbi:hypothetical protein CONPUDRAFT_86132 [Coniophora puteana RWD-64-598 SS2]|uniref:BTB domain-containing protein n=1 Tax=Coniophora puteana (strain RWD-64-598) TaxID=741705 RepID=A0A5M3N3C2_CONPW|nr:uncharacterized protein CONPUDRAFT_86132 [Coniophora puteana RWD-64-598 SS2]EIW85909.1 hypothetical protein CONPUDRAFT_86132 [Coniophora puteana RWD-64-598 SS2]
MTSCEDTTIRTSTAIPGCKGKEPVVQVASGAQGSSNAQASASSESKTPITLSRTVSSSQVKSSDLVGTNTANTLTSTSTTNSTDSDSSSSISSPSPINTIRNSRVSAPRESLPADWVGPSPTPNRASTSSNSSGSPGSNVDDGPSRTPSPKSPEPDQEDSGKKVAYPPPYAPWTVVDDGAGCKETWSYHYMNIAAMDDYKGMSPEELRMADYKLDRGRPSRPKAGTRDATQFFSGFPSVAQNTTAGPSSETIRPAARVTPQQVPPTDHQSKANPAASTRLFLSSVGSVPSRSNSIVRPNTSQGLSFPDASMVIRIGNTTHRVHHTILSQHSSVFRRLASLDVFQELTKGPNGDGDADESGYGKVPVEIDLPAVHETAIGELFAAIYNSASSLPLTDPLNPSFSFERLTTLLWVSAPDHYDVPYVRTRALRTLRGMYPSRLERATALSSFSSSLDDQTVVDKSRAHALDTIVAVRSIAGRARAACADPDAEWGDAHGEECLKFVEDLESVLPCAFYLAAQVPIEQVFDASASSGCGTPEQAAPPADASAHPAAALFDTFNAGSVAAADEETDPLAARLDYADVRRIVLGRERLATLDKEVLTPFLRAISSSSTTTTTLSSSPLSSSKSHCCTSALCARSTEPDHESMLRCLQARSDSVEAAPSDGIGGVLERFVEWEVLGLCSGCVKSQREAHEQARKEVWAQLKGVFDLE